MTNPNLESTRPRFSIRSLLVLTSSVAALCSVYRQIPLDSVIWPTAIYFVAWISPFASVGFDITPARRGLLTGGIAGLIVGALVLICLMQPEVRD